ncbi:rabGTPase-activating protein [Reticulomyxa filosa]|uniref:RabGTPase-activating protein n=1 Tax=Reticulomyxa filosa TaxID=46433 RepID=X6N8H6_RETFI|nr:rabGTPase-activating protein [Reticulomyxa filosa]|eukprot:ETO22213.1 rabGTPase-activating protein [Reticulomyxa filosa]
MFGLNGGNGRRFCCCADSDSTSINLNDIDSDAIWLKHERRTRRHRDYQLLRKLARRGCKEEDRQLLWIKSTNASEEDMVRYSDLTKTLFEDIEMQDFPQFPMFGSKCRFKTLDSEKKYCARKILVVLAVEHDSLHYCPQIPFVVEVIIQHVEEKVAFAILNAMVDVSKKNDWYFRTDFFNFRVRLRTFIDVFADHVKLCVRKCIF